MGVVEWVGFMPWISSTHDIVITSIGYGGLDNADIVEFTAEVTGWDTDTLITGINIIEDMLFWTDNETEPKKINIPRSDEGTYLYDNMSEIRHTHLITNHNDEGLIKESHITVIKPKPTTRINLEMKVNEFVNTGTYGWVNWNGRKNTNASPLAKPGDTITLVQSQTIDTVSFDGTKKFDYNPGDVILLKWSPLPVSASDFPINKYEVKARLIQIANNDFTSSTTALKLLILDVNHENYPGTNSASFSPGDWALQKQSSDESLFELKFPRFSYRWKFEDGEYSTFAPWSNVGFLPGDFQWLPKEGFNLGMKNHLKELVLFDFVPPNTPKDVVQIDLLYKESDSPNVYIIDSLKPDDPPPISGTGVLTNPWNSDGSQGAVSSSDEAQLPKGKYPITSETIFATVSPNQTLRNWDAVPRKALAQEIIGNRLTYANYERNFDLTPLSGEFKQDLTVSFKSYDVGKWEKKSVKTIRDYQVGIAYIDEYGRETPVFTNNDSVVNIPKLFSDKSNILYSKINHLAPAHADAYKFYIKENSRKYYNLVMDRWYDAEDGDIWLSFNSHDRNKVDEETFLYLKRGHDGGIVEDNYKYKILSIKNEAPEFIRNVRKQFGIKPHDPTDALTWGLGAINSI